MCVHVLATVGAVLAWCVSVWRTLVLAKSERFFLLFGRVQ